MPRFLLLILICFAHCSLAQPAGCFIKTGHELTLQTDKPLSQTDAWLVGELHGVYGTAGIKLALIKYLHDHNGINDVFMEMSYSAAWLYNRYLQTGDTTLFMRPFLVYSYKTPNRHFWKQLYTWNKNLKDKITIHGTDFERLEFIKVLKLLKPVSTSIPEEIVATVKGFDTVTINNINDAHLIALYEQIQTHVSQHREAYKRYYGTNFATVEQILVNAYTRSAFARRNETMLRNIQGQVEQNAIKKFIVFTGLNHADKSNDSSLCGRLDRYLNHKLTTISMLCKDCYDWQLPLKERYAAFKAPRSYVNDQILINSIYIKYYTDQCIYSLVNTGSIDDKSVRSASDLLILLKDQPEF